jgi:hypothetical protein
MYRCPPRWFDMFISFDMLVLLVLVVRLVAV